MRGANFGHFVQPVQRLLHELYRADVVHRPADGMAIQNRREAVIVVEWDPGDADQINGITRVVAAHKVHVGTQRLVGDHDAFRLRGAAAGVLQEGQFVRFLLAPVQPPCTACPAFHHDESSERVVPF